MTKRKSLSTIVAESLAATIRSGQLQPGAQLPTEAALCRRYDVSRTVVREVVARLRSDGMVVPHQGRGVFVSDRPHPDAFLITAEMLESLPETLALLELRLSVEVEAAGLCAERRTEAEASAIRKMMDETDARREDPTTVNIHYDYDVHLAIAEAARNALIHGFLTYLRPLIVPASSWLTSSTPVSRTPTTRASMPSTRLSRMRSRGATVGPPATRCGSTSSPASNGSAPWLQRPGSDMPAVCIRTRSRTSSPC